MIWVGIGVMVAVTIFLISLYSLQKNIQSAALIKKLGDDFAAVCAGAVGLGDRLERMEEQIGILSERQDQLELREPVLQSYKQAKKLLNGGMDTEELMENCGVTRGEAELMAVLHRLEG